MDVAALLRIDEVFGFVNDPAISVDYNLSISTNHWGDNSEIITIIRETDNPLSSVRCSISIKMSDLLLEIGMIRKECANINAVLSVIRYHPSGVIRKYYYNSDITDLAKFIAVQWDAKKFEM